MDSSLQPVTLRRPAARAALTRAQRWSVEAVQALFDLPFTELVFRAAEVHRAHSTRGSQISTLLSIKTGGCPEDCGYCPQAARYDTGVEATKLMDADEVLQAARAPRTRRHPLLHGRRLARAQGPRHRQVAEMVHGVKALGMETCMTLGMLTSSRRER